MSAKILIQLHLNDTQWLRIFELCVSKTFYRIFDLPESIPCTCRWGFRCNGWAGSGEFRPRGGRRGWSCPPHPGRMSDASPWFGAPVWAIALRRRRQQPKKKQRPYISATYKKQRPSLLTAKSKQKPCISTNLNKQSSLQGADISHWIVCAFHPAAPGSSPKHTIYAFINLHLNYVIWKRLK